MTATDQPGTDKDYSSLPLDYYGPGMGFLYTRNKWGADATTLLIQMKGVTGTGDHYHEDAGSFQIWRNGQWLSRETTGYGDPLNGFNNGPALGAPAAIAHNVVLFNGWVQTGLQHGKAVPAP